MLDVVAPVVTGHNSKNTNGTPSSTHLSYLSRRKELSYPFVKDKTLHCPKHVLGMLVYLQYKSTLRFIE